MTREEVPDKIHIGIRPSEFGGCVLTTVDKDFPNAVEYTHTDAFIEKACEWLAPVFKDLAGYYSGAELLDDFKNYMKGE